MNWDNIKDKVTWEWSKTPGRRAVGNYSIPLYMKCAIEQYAKEQGFPSKSAAVEKILEAGMIALGISGVGGVKNVKK